MSNTITCNHKYIYDNETSEDICCNCGCVAYRSYEIEGTNKIIEGEKAQEMGAMMNAMTMKTNLNLELGNMPMPINDTSSVELNNVEFATNEVIVPRQTEMDFSCGGLLSTKIDTRNTDFVGKKIDKAHFGKMRHMNNYILSSEGLGTYKRSIWLIKSVSDRLSLPPFVQERAGEIFRKMYFSRTNIHNSKNIVCACLYYACKEARIDRTLSDLANAVMEKPKYKSDIFITFQKVIKHLGLNTPKNFSTVDEIHHLGARMGLSEKICRYAADIYLDVKSRDRIYFSGKDPKLIATILLYISSSIHDRYRIDLDDFSDITKINTYILRKRIHDHLAHPNFEKYRMHFDII